MHTPTSSPSSSPPLNPAVPTVRRLPMLGIDVSKDRLDVALADPLGGIVDNWHTANSAQGIRLLLEKVPADAAWVVEPTGRYSLLVVQQGRQAGRTVLMAPTRQAKRYADSHHPRATTDRTAAQSLAHFGLDRRLCEYPLKSEDVDEIDQLQSARRGLGQALTELHLRQQSLPRAAHALEPSIQALKEQVKQLDQQIRQAVKRSPLCERAERLRPVPGVGSVASTAFASRLASKGFAHPDQWVAYCGMDVAIRQSGQRKGELGLTKQGDAELRRLAYLCAQAAVRAKDSPFRAQFERERAKGLSKVAAYCAVARKILRLVWSLDRHQTTYDPTLVFLHPSERRKRRQQQEEATNEQATNELNPDRSNPA